MPNEHCFQKCSFRDVGCADPVPYGEDIVGCDDREMGDAMTVIGASMSYDNFVALNDHALTSAHQSKADMITEYRTEVGDIETEDNPMKQRRQEHQCL